jgi:hypothetical protein
MSRVRCCAPHRHDVDGIRHGLTRNHGVNHALCDPHRHACGSLCHRPAPARNRESANRRISPRRDADVCQAHPNGNPSLCPCRKKMSHDGHHHGSHLTTYARRKTCAHHMICAHRTTYARRTSDGHRTICAHHRTYVLRTNDGHRKTCAHHRTCVLLKNDAHRKDGAPFRESTRPVNDRPIETAPRALMRRYLLPCSSLSSIIHWAESFTAQHRSLRYPHHGNTGLDRLYTLFRSVPTLQAPFSRVAATQIFRAENPLPAVPHLHPQHARCSRRHPRKRWSCAPPKRSGTTSPQRQR